MSSWLIPCSPDIYDADAAFQETNANGTFHADVAVAIALSAAC